MKSKSIKTRSLDEFKSALDKSMADGFTPTLALAFISKDKTGQPLLMCWMQKALVFLAAQQTENLSTVIPTKVPHLFYCLTSTKNLTTCVVALKEK